MSCCCMQDSVHVQSDFRAKQKMEMKAYHQDTHVHMRICAVACVTTELGDMARSAGAACGVVACKIVYTFRVISVPNKKWR